MGDREKFDLLDNEKIDKNIYFYLKDIFDELNIEVLGQYIGNLFDLMKKGKLEGWCWQTTETAALFMKDDTIVYRGNLHLNDYKSYYHSFIEFEYEGKKYVFDPCFCMINTSDLYFNTFNIDIRGKATAKEIKDYFINYINNPPKRDDIYSEETLTDSDRFMRKFFGDDYLDKKKKEVVIYDQEDPSAPMYRNGSGYKDVCIENNKIKRLTVHYYLH